MRGCLFVLVLGAAVLVGGTWLAGPTVVGGAAGVVLAASGLSGEETSVEVRADPPLELLRLRADEVRVRSRDATFRELRADTLDLVLGDVDLGARTFERIEGRLDGVLVVRDGATDVRVQRIVVEGEAPRPAVRLVLAAAEVELLVASAIEASSGLRPSNVALQAPDRLSFALGGVTVGGQLGIDATGGLVLDPDAPIVEAADLFRPEPGLPLRLRSVTVTADELTLAGELVLE